MLVITENDLTQHEDSDEEDEEMAEAPIADNTSVDQEVI